MRLRCRKNKLGSSVRGTIGHGAWFLVFLLPRALLGGAPVGEAESPLHYTIIVTGDELLSGVYADGHTYFITRTLRPLGLRCVGSIAAADRASDIKQAIDFADKHSQLIIVTGGLGPTDSDITRTVLSEITGIPLQEHPQVLQAMERRFQTSRDRLRPNLRRQTRVPVRGTYLPNRSGTAVGLVFETDRTVIVALPGPPSELQPMVTEQLVPYLARRFGTKSIGCSLTVRFIGIGQSQIDQTMKQHIALPEQVVQSSQFERGRVDFTFSLPTDSEADHARLERLRSGLHKYLDKYIYADDATTTLEQCVAGLLDRKGHKLVLAEVGSGGAVAASIAQEPSGSQILAGAFVAPTEERLFAMLGMGGPLRKNAAADEQLTRVADTIADRMQADWALVTGGLRAGGDGTSGRITLALRDPGGTVQLRAVARRGDGAEAQAFLATRIVDLLRRELQ